MACERAILSVGYGSTAIIDIFNSFSAGAVFGRNNLTSLEVILLTYKHYKDMVPSLKGFNSEFNIKHYNSFTLTDRISVK